MLRWYSFFMCLCIHLFVWAGSSGPVLLIVGTRPDAIKMIPVYQALQEKHVPTFLCSTGQHAEMLTEVFSLFEVTPDEELHIMKPGQDLTYLTTSVLTKVQEVIARSKPSLVVVQGDTTSAMAGAMAAFYEKVPVAHVEAGLRTGNVHAPFPEELNRRIITLLSTLHFAPTPAAVQQLEREGINKETIYHTGNTVVDALYSIVGKLQAGTLIPLPALVELVQAQKNAHKTLILLTAHRRESFDGGLQRIFVTMKRVLQEHPSLFVVFPVHPNPAVQKALRESGLSEMPNIAISPPLPYSSLVYLLEASSGVATDSGGISEEAVSLHKPVLILRNETDRPEGVQTGDARLVGTDEEKILAGIEWILRKSLNGAQSPSPYGDGKAAKRIADEIEKYRSGVCACANQ
jgi:UDP-N-acetylglucosamine 2-epimerase (non-hydrolysing)